MSLPEIIPPGTYVVNRDEDGDELVIDIWRGSNARQWCATVGMESSELTEAQARHLLAMPGRPHDDRLDGPVTPNRIQWKQTRPNEETPMLDGLYAMGPSRPITDPPPAESPREDKP